MKRIISVILCIMTLLSAVPMTASVADDNVQSNPFIDVLDGKWYTDSVLWCYDSGLMMGVSSNQFGVTVPVSRSMFVTILSKLDGADTSVYDETVDGLPFEDVKAGSYYIRALKWAYNNNYTSGVSATRFGTNDPVSREQLATFLRTYALAQGRDVSASADLSVYKDESSISGWAKDAVSWAVASEMISGTSADTLSPKKSATRAQVALIVKNFVENVLDNVTLVEPDYVETTVTLKNTADVAFVLYAKGDAYTESEFMTAYCNELGADKETVGLEFMISHNCAYERNDDGEIVIEGLYGSNTLLVAYNDGSIELINHYFDPEADYPVASLMLGDYDVSEFAIVYGTTSRERKMTAQKLAQELATDIEMACGVRLEIYADTEREAVEGAKEILIGKTNREDAGFVTVDRSELVYNTLYIEMKDNYLILASNEECAGTHSAVYEFLRTYVGFTYYAKELYHIEHTAKAGIANGVKSVIRPGMDFNINYQLDGDLLSLGEPSEAGLHFANGVHSLPELAREDYNTSWDFHKQWFMSPDPCLSDPAIIDTMIRNVKTLAQYSLDHGDKEPLIWLTMSDGSLRGCQCEACKKTYSAMGVHSTYSFICNYVADAIAEEYPTVKIVGIAYKFTIHAPKAAMSDEAYAAFVEEYKAILAAKGWSDDYIPPQDPKAPSNAIMCVATDNSCFSHAIDDPDCKNRSNNNVTFNTNFERWCEIYDTIYVWDYFTGDSYRHCPFPNVHEMWENYNYYYRHNVTGMYGLGDSERYADFSELRTYIVSQLSMYPGMSEDDFFLKVNKFLEVFYGEGWPAIREYIEVTEELSSENEWHIWTKCKWNHIITEAQYRENIDYLVALWQSALDNAGSSRQKYNVLSSMVAVRYIEVMLAYADYAANKTPENLAAFRTINNTFVNILDQCGYSRPKNWTIEGNPNYWENS